MGTSDTMLSTTLSHLPKLPSAPIEPIRQTLSHLLSTPVHPLYPSQDVLRFGVLHAVRVASAWEGMKRAALAARRAREGAKGAHVTEDGDEARVGVLGDLLGYLVTAWGGTTLICILLGLPPPWLTSSTPWVTYLPIYFLLNPTGLSSILLSLIPSPLFSLSTCIVDGLIRSTAIASTPFLIASSPTVPGSGTLWSATILATIAITGGGFLVDLFGLAATGKGGGWAVGQPGLLKGGILGTADAWSAALVAIAHAGMMGTYHVDTLAGLKDVSNQGSAGAMTALAGYARRVMLAVLPSELLYPPYGTAASHASASAVGGSDAPTALVSPDVARAIVALLLMSVYLAKSMTLSILSPTSSSSSSSSTLTSKKNKKKKGVAVKGIQLDEAEKDILEAVTHEKAESVLQSITANGDKCTGRNRGQGGKVEGAGSGSARDSRASTPRKAAGKGKAA